MVTITAAELQRNFGTYREKALREPVSVTHHGRPSLVVMAADEFDRLKALDTRRAFYTWELPADLAGALKDASPAPESAQFNYETPT